MVLTGINVRCGRISNIRNGLVMKLKENSLYLVPHRMFSSIKVLRSFVILFIRRSSSAETVSKALDSRRPPVADSDKVTSAGLVPFSG